MAFLFKSSKKNQDRALAARDGNTGSQSSAQSAAGRMSEKGSAHQRGTPTGSLNSLENDVIQESPNRGHGRRGGSIDQTQQLQSQAQIQPQQQQQSDLPFRNGPQMNNANNASLYPWSQRRLTYTSSHPSPFPRYGAAVNSLSSKEGDIYMMGGLINSSTVKGDLWLIEAGGNMACYPLATTAEGPGPRVGHSSLLVGNAFIVYGGDTKIDESDVLDETLYLLNTSTRQWSRALPAGPRPSGRYGHSLNILGSKIYIFGGQVENEFMNDMSAFDLNQLQMPNNRWELLLTGENSPKMPAARTNHSVITYNDKMYLFGGTNGLQWFNDVWCYDPMVNTWMQLDCIGYIPAPREGHAAAMVDDVMYIFGGRTEEGTDLGDLAAFRITTRRWYTFQNMGPSPSSRSGHSMTTVGKSIVTFGGEPSSAASSANDLGVLYVLDTTKIRYPTDAQQAAQKQAQGQGRRPSLTDAPGAPRAAGRDGSAGPSDQRRIMGVPTNAGTPPNGHRSPPPNAIEGNMQAVPAPQGSKLPRAATGSVGPPPSGPVPMRPGEQPSNMGRARGASADRSGPAGSPQIGSSQQSPVTRGPIPENEPAPIGIQVNQVNGRSTPTQPQAPPQVQPPRAGSKQGTTNWDGSRNTHSRQARSKGSLDISEPPKGAPPPRPASPPAPTRQPSNPLSRRSSGRNSQTVVLLKELDSARNRNAWYASELELAKKAGYVSATTSSPALEGKLTETFDDEDRPLIEALLAMRTELANVQGAVDKQAALSSQQIAEVEKQRDTAIQEALYAKARLAAQPQDRAFSHEDAAFRSDGMSKKLASALYLQKELQSQLAQARTDLDNEKRARKLADDTTSAAQNRMSDLENYKQQTSTEVERLKAELHMVQREAREHSVSSADAVAALALLKTEKEDLGRKYEEAIGSSKNHDDTFVSLRAAIAASEDGKNHLQSKLDEERGEKELIEAKLNKLKVEHEARTAELVTTTQRLRDAEEVAEKHATEAKTHRAAVLAGLDKISLRDESKAGKADADRLVALQAQVDSSSSLVKKYQEEADAAADQLRSAEERIAGLEQYQEQSSREGVGIRRQLQSAMRDTQTLQATNTDLKNRLAAQQLETNAMTVQHSALKDILSERGISPTAAGRTRGLASPRTASPEQGRLRDLESQLLAANAAHEETKQSFVVQQQESETMYREKLSQLENDYRSAVHYVKGTEQMLKQLKEQLNRYKSENGQLKSEIEQLEDKLQAGGQKGAVSADWDTERGTLQQKIEGLEAELRDSGVRLQQELDAVRHELATAALQRDEALKDSDEATQHLNSQRKHFEQMRTENAQLEKRANDAEQKVSLLLDQVENSVDNYRRQSRQAHSMNSDLGANTNGLGTGHSRNESSEVESNYGGNNNNASEARNSAALDKFASELETLRTHWEATNKNYRLSTNFDLDPNGTKKDDDGGIGLSESLADWRKKLDTEERNSGISEKTRPT